MKKVYLVFSSLLLLLMFTSSNAQTVKDSWSLNFGLSYPRLVSTNIAPNEFNFGGFVGLQRNFTESVGLRLNTRFSNLSGDYANNQTSTTTLITGNFEFIYEFVPCQKISPYILAGTGLIYYSVDNPPDPQFTDSHIDYQISLGFGAVWRLWKNWNFTTELGYYSVSNSTLDGLSNTDGGGLLGSINDTYMSFDIGLKWFFDKGEPSPMCDQTEGLREIIESLNLATKDDVEEIVKQHIPKEVVKEVVVEKPVYVDKETKLLRDNWVLVGVNFDINSTKLRPEAIPVLLHAAQVLLQNPGIKVEIQGYTDNIGPGKMNQKISEKRAEVVRNYLMGKGVKEDRLSIIGYGESNPIADNKTPEGRAMNRRIEFKVLD
ncbi:MAG: OmpA family protein [Melioribacteraceae bacterium]|nr:OmpA family protein [Melioribacteraceae bacterium]MCF8356872.1 OmpA family protein [Melioribacteraceae bacterium]MCF8394527.1 OmpA family protein [Melioribacteraceae bacterium]MCF8420143.1 OmpA family protein [Melioribacteraceae bacterium]